MLVFRYHHIQYDTNVTLTVLNGAPENKLRFDFAIYEGDTLKTLIDCHTKSFYLNLSKMDESNIERRIWEAKHKWCGVSGIQFVCLTSQRDITREVLENRLRKYKLLPLAQH